jgi:hypothetical protein
MHTISPGHCFAGDQWCTERANIRKSTFPAGFAVIGLQRRHAWRGISRMWRRPDQKNVLTKTLDAFDR